MEGSAHRAPRPAWDRRFGAGLAAFALAYVVAARLGLQLAIPPGNVTVVWPPSGIAVAALLLGGPGLWPVIPIATLLVTASTAAPLGCALGFALGNTLEALAARRWLRPPRFDAARMSLRDVGRLVSASGAAATIAAVLGAATLVVTGTISAADFDLTLATWWLGDALGMLLVVPFVLLWARPVATDRPLRWGELALVLATTAALATLVFRWLPSSRYLTFLPLLWAASRLGLRGVVSVVMALWILGALHLGAAGAGADRLPALAALGASQLYFAVCGIVGLALGGAINERDRAREALRSRDAWAQAIFDRLFDIVAVLDARGVARWVTPSVAHVLGYPPAEMIGRPLGDVIHPDDLDTVRARLARLVGEPRATARIRARCRRADGEWVTLETTATNALDNPSVRGVVICARDVTTAAAAARVLERARAAALESARLRSEFLANVSHELRTPLNVVFGLTDMLLDDGVSPRHADQIRRIRTNASGLLRLIDDILDLAKIDAGRLEVHPRPVRLAAIVDDAIGALRPRAATKGLELETAIDPVLGAPLRADPDRIRQILLNFLTNAVKFTDAGRVRLSVTALAETATAVRVRFEVQDSGIGIPAERRHRLFLPFSQIDGSMSRRYEGTGLGLAISKQLAELMGGGVGVSSMPGLGSIFWCDLPLEKVAGPAAALPGAGETARRPESAPAAPPASRTQRVP